MFELGKSDISTITGRVELLAQGDNGSRKRVGAVRVTTNVLPQEEFIQAISDAGGDAELLKRLIKNIEAADEATQVPPYTPDLIDAIFQTWWQFQPIFDFVMTANNPRLAQALKLKNY